MIWNCFPKAYAPDVFSIDYEKLYSLGYRGILFDVDNTLVPHNADANEQVEELFCKIQALGLRTILVSNNDTPRLQRFLKNISCDFIPDAGKPRVLAYEKALHKLGIPASQAVFVGDQMFIDIYGANRAGVDSIMVHYFASGKKEKLGIRRRVENVLLFFFSFPFFPKKLGEVIIGRY